MTVGRAVAAQRGAALLARAQIDPLRAQLHALGALPAFGLPDRPNGDEMRAGTVGHGRLAYSCSTWCTATIAIDPSPRPTPPNPMRTTRTGTP